MLDGFMNAFSGLGGYFKAHEGLPFAPLSLVRAHAPRALAFVSEEVELRMGAGPLADFVQPEGVKGEEGLQLLRIVDDDDGVVDFFLPLMLFEFVLLMRLLQLVLFSNVFESFDWSCFFRAPF